MKRILTSIFTIFLLLSFTACSQTPSSNSKIGITLYNENTKEFYNEIFDNTDTIIIGRQDTSDIVIPNNKYISRTHCSITFNGETIYLTDLDSTNGTFVTVDGIWTKISDTVEIVVGEQFMLADTILTLQKCEIEN